MKDLHLVAITVNGVRHELAVESRRTLADVLRADLGLTGTHLGCEHGICGTCTVLVDGAPTRSCLLFGVQADDCRVDTVEGLAGGPGGDELSDLQEAFSRCHALQCGFCTPGFLMLAEGFLAESLDRDDEEIRDLVAANLCRCTGYVGIVDAVRETAESRRRAAGEPPGDGATGDGATGDGATGDGATGDGATGDGATGDGDPSG